MLPPTESVRLGSRSLLLRTEPVSVVRCPVVQRTRTSKTSAPSVWLPSRASSPLPYRDSQLTSYSRYTADPNHGGPLSSRRRTGRVWSRAQVREIPARLLSVEHAGVLANAEVQSSCLGRINNKSYSGVRDVYCLCSLASSSRSSGISLGSRMAHIARNALMSAAASLVRQARCMLRYLATRCGTSSGREEK